MTTVTGSRSRHSYQDDVSTNGDAAISFIWLAFYLAIFVVAIASPIGPETLELAAR